MNWINDYRSFKDFLSVVVVCAPDNFSREHYLTDAEQLTLDKAEMELKAGIQYLPKSIRKSDQLHLIEQLLLEAFAAYRGGEGKKGASLLQDIEDIIAPGRYSEYATRKQPSS